MRATWRSRLLGGGDHRRRMKIWPFGHGGGKRRCGQHISPRRNCATALKPFEKIRKNAVGRPHRTSWWSFHSLWQLLPPCASPQGAWDQLSAPYWHEGTRSAMDSRRQTSDAYAEGLPRAHLRLGDAERTRWASPATLHGDRRRGGPIVMLRSPKAGAVRISGEARKIGVDGGVPGTMPVAPHGSATGPVVLTASTHLSLECAQTQLGFRKGRPRPLPAHLGTA